MISIQHSGINTDYLAHYGKLGQKWGIRRFQNEDGSLTPLGEERYRKKMQRSDDKYYRRVQRQDEKYERKIQRQDERRERNEIRRQERSDINADAKALSRMSSINPIGRVSRRVALASIAAKEGRAYANRVSEKARIKKLTRTAVKAAAVVGASIVVGKLASNGFKRTERTFQKVVQDGARKIALWKASVR